MNPRISSVDIDSFPGFLAEIERISAANTVLWFRGISDISYTLSPSIYRNPYEAGLEESFQNKFRSRALPFLRSRPVESYWEWLFLMQHYGVPTRLLDWSSSALVALGFAIMHRVAGKVEDAAVWCLNPIKLNESSRVILTPLDKIPDISANTNAQASYKFDAAARAEYPLAITGPLNSPRIAAQKGAFTIYPNSERFNLEEKNEAEHFLTRLVIKSNAIETLKKQLYYLGMTETTLYPDLDNLAKEIKREFTESLPAVVPALPAALLP